jgi:hypothetical protein
MGVKGAKTFDLGGSSAPTVILMLLVIALTILLPSLCAGEY